MPEAVATAALPVRRNTLLLSASMAALYGMVQLSSALATVTFVAVTGFGGLAGLGPAIFLTTAALGAFPAGRAMDRFGRVPVLAAGFGTGVAGCVSTGLGALLDSAAAVVAGFALIGAATGTVLLSRVAAAEMYPPERRTRGISVVLFGAVFGALLGPLVFGPLLVGGGEEAGALAAPWFAGAGFALAGIVLVLLVRPDPKRIGELIAADGVAGAEAKPSAPAAPLAQILRRDGVVPALLSAVASFSVMAATMTLAGYVLVGHGHHDESAVFPILSAHFVGMFGLVLFVGGIIERVGRRRALVGGLVVLGASVFGIVPAAESVVATSVALFGIGIGWSFSFVAATAELVERTTPAERGRVLGLNDLLSNLLGAALALLGGLALAGFGLVALGVGGALLALAPVPLILLRAEVKGRDPA